MHASKEEPAPSSKNSKKAPFGKDYLEVMRNFNLPELQPSRSQSKLEWHSAESLNGL